MTAEALLLRERTVLLHVGPHKTGTTAIQGALFRARPRLAEHGVLHAGRTRHPMQAVRALRGLPPPVGFRAATMADWQVLVDQVAAAEDMRVIVSSEHFADVDVETAQRAVRELGGTRVHVVVTLRPLRKIMPSMWQEWVKYQSTSSYDSLLDALLRKPADDWQTRTFWLRHHHDELVERWASVVGSENVTVIVLDEADRGFLLRRFEELVGLPTGALVAEPDTENRSMTLGEIELMRLINVEFGRRGWSWWLHRKVVRRGLGFRMQTNRVPESDEPRITTPQWALDLAAEIGAAAAARISASGVRVVGDISTLGARTQSDEPAATGGPIVLPVAAVRDAVIGTILASGLTRATPVEELSSRDLLRIVLGRVRRRLLKIRQAPPSSTAGLAGTEAKQL